MASETGKSQLKVLEAIYSVTDCSNGVYDYARLHWRQAKIADEMPSLVESIEGCVEVDGDKFRLDNRCEGKGYRLTNAGYEALSRQWPEAYPSDRRRFWADQAKVPDSKASNAKQLASLVLSYSDNEATAFPYWAIASKGGLGKMVPEAGIWFCRERAEEHLKAKAYRFPKNAFVFCFSGHDSGDMKDLRDIARRVMAEEGVRA